MGVTALNLPQSPRAAVYRAMEGIVRQNPIIQRIIKPTSFRTWSGLPEDAREFTFEIAPALRWTPINTADTFTTPDSMRGDLLINCEMLIKGCNVDDMQNLWYAIMRCFYPVQTTPQPNPVPMVLITAGARSGLVLFSQPAFDPGPDGTWLAGQGQLKIEIQSNVSS